MIQTDAKTEEGEGGAPLPPPTTFRISTFTTEPLLYFENGVAARMEQEGAPNSLEPPETTHADLPVPSFVSRRQLLPAPAG